LRRTDRRPEGDSLIIDDEPSLALVRHLLEHAPVAAAVVSGAAHGRVFTNAKFRRLSAEA